MSDRPKTKQLKLAVFSSVAHANNPESNDEVDHQQQKRPVRPIQDEGRGFRAEWQNFCYHFMFYLNFSILNLSIIRVRFNGGPGAAMVGPTHQLG